MPTPFKGLHQATEEVANLENHQVIATNPDTPTAPNRDIRVPAAVFQKLLRAVGQDALVLNADRAMILSDFAEDMRLGGYTLTIPDALGADRSGHTRIVGPGTIVFDGLTTTLADNQIEIVSYDHVTDKVSLAGISRKADAYRNGVSTAVDLTLDDSHIGKVIDVTAADVTLDFGDIAAGTMTGRHVTTPDLSGFNTYSATLPPFT